MSKIEEVIQGLKVGHIYERNVIKSYLWPEYNNKWETFFKAFARYSLDEDRDFIYEGPRQKEKKIEQPTEEGSIQTQQVSNTVIGDINIGNNNVINIIINSSIQDVWLASNGWWSNARVSNKAIRKALADNPNKMVLREVMNILTENMSQNNFIKEHVSHNWLVRNADGYFKIDSIKRIKPIQVLESMGLIAVNEKKQVMVNPNIAACVGLTEEKLNSLSEMYEEFKSTGKFKPRFTGTIPEQNIPRSVGVKPRSV